MKKNMKKFFLIVSVVMLLGIVGAVDWADNVVYNMPQPAYACIRSKIGDRSHFVIAREYYRHKSYYDGLSNQ